MAASFTEFLLDKHKNIVCFAGNLQLGVLKHRGKFYSFSSKEAALKFASRPDDLIAEIEKKVKCAPELLHLLRFQQEDFSLKVCS